MRLLWSLLLAATLLAALAPEVARYRAEHKLYRVTGGFYAVRADPKRVADPVKTLDWLTSEALAAADDLPGDPRPWMVAAGAQLMARKTGAAIELYRRVLALGERPEIELNLGQAYMMLGDRERATAALLRAGWVNPAILATIPAIASEPILEALREREARLVAGGLTAPPPSSLAPRG